MLELISLALGGLLRLAPELLKLLTARDERAHELEMTQLQLQIDRARSEQQIDLVHANATAAQMAADSAALVEALKAQAAPSGVKWIDALSSSVRPVLTYWWCVGLYTAYKLVSIAALMQQPHDAGSLAAELVTDFDRAVIGSIFAFWFVDRSIRRP